MQQIKVSYLEKNDIRDIEGFQRISQARWQDACGAFGRGDYFAAVYLSGYSAECILKYVLVKVLLGDRFAAEKSLNLKMEICRDRPLDVLKKHSLGKLIELGNRRAVFKTPKDVDYQEILTWTSEWRYALAHNVDKENAEQFLKSISKLSRELKRECNHQTGIRVKVLALGGESDEVFNQ